MDEASNTWPLGIFTGYMATAAALTASSIAIIRNGPSSSGSGSSRPRLALALFSVLAAISLATTWYHMFCFFQWSYQEWAREHPLVDPEKLHLGAWLRGTALFEQAWASTLETPARSWWSLQIFGFCANWSVMLADQERKRRIPHLWIFMLLGQVVAISFASNMFFLAVLVHDRIAPPPSSNTSKRCREQPEPDWLLNLLTSAPFWYDPIVILTLALAAQVPSMFGQPNFMPLLLAPHLLAFAPLLLNRVLPLGSAGRILARPSRVVKIGSMTFIVGWATIMVKEQGGNWETILSTLHEHPAVSSVGWDVVCCWVSYTAWHLVGGP